MKIPSKRPFETIFKKMSNLGLNQKSMINSEVSKGRKSIVSVDVNKIVYKKTKKTFSVKFINYVEPYEIGGVRLTAFYTEVDHNLEKGNRIFIVGGNYDSDLIIKNDKFNKKSDGYIVQFVDRTKIVLDIEWVDVNPWNQEPVDNFIKIYVSSSQEEFDYFLSNVSGSGKISTGSDHLLSNRFAYDSVSLNSNNNILFTNGTFSVSSNKYLIPNGTFGNSFVVFELTDVNTSTLQGQLLDISSDILSGDHTSLFPYSQNERLFILNDSFKLGGVKFKENHIYKFNQLTSKWEIDRTYMPAFICEQNFRNGRIVKGSYNQGVLGNGIEEIEYDGVDVEFNLGTVLSVNWNSGLMRLGEGNSDSYFTEYDGINPPSIKVNSKNNSGFGYNYSYHANFINGSFANGNFYNSIFGSPSNNNSMHNHLIGNALTYSVITSGGNYIDSKIEYGKISGSLLTNSEIINSEVLSSKSVNSEIERSVFKKSKYLSDKIIKIDSYSEHLIYRPHNSSADSIKRFRLLKFYISEENFKKIKALQNFYISGLEFTSGFSSDILNFFDDKFTIGDYYSSIDRLDVKRIKNYVSQISTKEDNKYLPSGTQSIGDSVIISPNVTYSSPSLDLMIIDGLESFLGSNYSFFDVSGVTISSGSMLQFIIGSSSFSTTYSSATPGFYDLVDNLNSNYSFVINSIFGYDDGLRALYTDNLNLSSVLIDGNTCSSTIKPGPKINISNGYILDSDFKSGIFEDSDWITGNYINYNKDNAISTTASYYAQSSLGTSSGNPLLTVQVNDSIRYNLFNQGDVIFLNGMHYDTTLNGGNNLVKLPNSYLVNQITDNTNGRSIELIDTKGTQSLIWNLPQFTSQDYLITKNAENSYNYIHPVKFINSRIESGIFIRSYFEKCIFRNKEFNVLDRDITFNNSRKLLITDVIFDDNGNDIKAGLFRYSSFIGGSDRWNGGILYNSIWNKSSFTYSLTATSSSLISVTSSPFLNGIVKKSRWVWGEFNGGIFLNNKSNQIGTQSVFSETVPVHWRTGFKTRHSWIDGIFNGGEFESSNWELGKFTNGELFNSIFFNGIATGGFFGRRNVPYGLTKILSGTFSNLNVINAEFRTQDPTGQISSTFSIDWYSGKFQSGLFGVLVGESEYENLGESYPFHATWHDGEFNNGEFTDISRWKEGKFNGGKFTSYYGYPFIHVSDYTSMTQSNFAWQGGEFNGGEFGNFSTSSNSTWYNGEFNGGIFSGKYWRDGVFTRGSFIGSGTSSTTLSNIPKYVSDFSDYFYGLWENGYVTESKEKVITDKKFFTKLEREFTKKKRRPNVEFSGTLWRGGTFSHSDGVMKNSVWLDGSFDKGTFKNSSFNPYVSYIENSNFQTLDGWEIGYSDVQPTGANLDLIASEISSEYNNLVWSGTSSVTIAYQTSGLIVGETYSLSIIVNNLEDALIRYGSWTTPINGNFNTSDHWILLKGGSGTVSMVVGQPGHVSMQGGPDLVNDYSEIIYPNILTPGMDYRVRLHTFDESGTSIISVGSSNYTNPYIQDFNIDTPASGIFAVGGNAQYNVLITASYSDLNIRFSENGAAKIHGISITQNIDLPTPTSFPAEFNLTFSALGSNFGIEIYGDSSVVTNSGVDWSTIGYVDIQFVELVKGVSGFNLENTSIWKNGNFEESEFFISKWENGKWISGTAQGMIWENGIANYMNAYNIFWGGGLWRNGNWNGAPFNFSNISPSQSIVSPGFASDILTNISRHLQNIGDAEYRNIFINNAFTQSSIIDLLSDPELDNGIGSGSNQSIRDDGFGLTWSWSNSINSYTLNGLYWINSGSVLESVAKVSGNGSSKKLYARNDSLDIYIFDDITYQYDISIEYSCQYGPININPTTNPKVKFAVSYGQSGNGGNGGGVDVREVEILGVMPILSSSNYFGASKRGTLNYTFSPTNLGTQSTNAQKLNIQKISGGNQYVSVIIYRIDVKKRKINYDFSHNNMTYSIMSASPSYTDTLQLPELQYLGGANSGNQTTVQFGNGIFTSGTFSSVWENGVWNQGLRYDRKVIYFTDLRLFGGTSKPLAFKGSIASKGSNQRSYEFNVVKNAPPNPNKVSFKSTNWILSIQVSDSVITTESGHISNQIGIDLSTIFKIGDKVSVGNIIAIDINENRRLIRDVLTVINVEEDYISVQFTVNFPIRRVERDSSNHLIYVTKNIWQNGAFLNGTFMGVWNNGLFRGYPYITKMVDTEWIDGRFEGGTFKGLTLSSMGPDSEYESINSGLIQNFQIFKDQDQSILPFTHSYNSWIDVNYYTQSSVTIAKNNITFDSTPTYGIGEYSEVNFYRSPTYDVLRSPVTNLRNNYDAEMNSYTLGDKYKEYEDYLDDVGRFENYYDSNTEIGTKNLISDGFTWSTQLTTLSSNTNSSNSSKLRVSASSAMGMILGNTRLSQFKTKRYSYTSFDYDYSTDLEIAFASFGFNLIDPLSPSANLQDRKVRKIKEYHYNNRKLIGFINFATLPYNVYLSNLKFVETDSVPFFQLATESNINQSIASPLQAVSPFIDYSDNNFSLVDSLNISESIFVTIPSTSTVGSGGVISNHPSTETFNNDGRATPGFGPSERRTSGSGNLPSSTAPRVDGESRSLGG